MNAIASGFHPSFDALSKYADTPDVDRARTRVGRHVAACARCREIVDEIQAMGEAARAIEPPGAPDGLWSRIEQRVAHEDVGPTRGLQERAITVPVGRDVEGTGAMVRTPKSHDGDWQRRAALGIVVAAVVSTAVIVATSWRSLGAATPSRLSLSSEYLAPGRSVVARYRPITALADLPTLTVWARYEGATVTLAFDQPLMRAGTLQRVSPQEYTGSLSLPAGALVGFFAVGDSSGRVVDRSSGRPKFLATLVAADASGRPSFDALVTLLGQYRQRVEDIELARVADVMERHYPSRPETWLLTYPVMHRGMVHDIVKQFESHERAYAGWHSRLANAAGLSVYVELTMANIGDELMDTARAEFWSKRMMADHPGDGYVLDAWLRQYHPLPADSIGMVLAAFERMWERGNREPSGVELRALELAERSGDSALVRRWQRRVASTTPWWSVDWAKAGWLRDTSGLSELDAELHRELVAVQRDSIRTPRGGIAMPMVWSSPVAMALRSAARLGAIRTRLAAVQLLRGETLAAKESLDVVIGEAAATCPMPETIRWRVAAELRLGQMDGAREDLAYLATMENWRVATVGDSASQLLGARYSPESWSNAKAAAKEWHRSCFAATRERWRTDGIGAHSSREP